MMVKGFLLKDREEQEYLLAIQPATHGMFERLIVRQKALPLCWGTCNVSGTRPSLPWRGGTKESGILREVKHAERVTKEGLDVG